MFVVFFLHFFFFFFVCFNPFYCSLYMRCIFVFVRLHTRLLSSYSFAMLRCYLFFLLLGSTHSERECCKVNAPRQHLIKCRSISAAAFHLFIVKNRVTRAYNIIMYKQHTQAQTRSEKIKLPRVYVVRREKKVNAWCLSICSSLCEKELGCTREWMFNRF